MPSKPATKPKPKPTAPHDGGDVRATCDAIERYVGALKTDGVLALRPSVLKPQKPTAIASAEAKLGTPFPADLKAFLTRGLRAAEGKLDEPYAHLGFDFLDVAGIVKNTASAREIAGDGDDEHAALIRRGIAVTFAEPQLVVTDDGVWHFSFRNPPLRVAPSWAGFLTHWLAAGCFGSHSFTGLWAKVRKHVPVAITPAKNTWVRAYRKQFPSS